MRPAVCGLVLTTFLWGCARTPFLVADFDSRCKPKLKRVAILPFSLPNENVLAQKHRGLLEETVAATLAGADSLHSYVLPAEIRKMLGLGTDTLIGQTSPDRLGRLLSSEALVFTRVIRMNEAEGPNLTAREIGAGKFLERGVELLVEFRLVEAATGNLWWHYRVRRIGEDEKEAAKLVSRAVAEAWPLRLK